MSQIYVNILATDLISDSRINITDRDDTNRSCWLGTAEPSTMVAGQLWIDTTASLVKLRNATNTAWYTLGTYATNLGLLALAGGTMTGKITLDGNPTLALHAVPKQYADLFLLLAGGTMSGAINMGANKITNLALCTDATDGARKGYVDGLGYAINKGKAWISHGDNVITFANAHGDTAYKIIATLVNTAMGGVTTRGNAHTQPLSVLVKNDTASRGLVRINGGYGFTTCGYVAAVSAVTERYDNVTNAWTAKTSATTARQLLTGYSLNGLGFGSCGETAGANTPTGVTERFDDTINAHTARLSATARYRPSGYSLSGYGFSSGGYNAIDSVATTERFDDVANTHTARTNLNTARNGLAGYSLNGYGFTTCGYIAAVSAVTERFDDVANTHTARLDATARFTLAGYSLGGLGFTSGGNVAGVSSTTERFDDVANTHTARTNLNTARDQLAGFSLNGFGFTAGGFVAAVSLVTGQLDDTANTQTAKGNLNTARSGLSAYSTTDYFINYVTYA